eukprot:2217522-Rhodomonas_salina.2
MVLQQVSLIRLKRCDLNVATPLLPRNIGSRHSPPSIWPRWRRCLMCSPLPTNLWLVEGPHQRYMLEGGE